MGKRFQFLFTFLTCLLYLFWEAKGESRWFPGNPQANTSAVVTVGNARFTVLTSSLIRMEYDNTHTSSFLDTATMAIWNRNLPVPSFTAVPNAMGVVITTDTLILNYTGQGILPFDDRTLSITLLNPSYSNPNGRTVWTPSQTVGTDPGQLFGTFHTLDEVDGTHYGGLNCSLFDPMANGDVISYYPCDFGLLSLSGWSMIDDSRRPPIINDWPTGRTEGICDINATYNPRIACVPGSWISLNDENSCTNAGCCWDPSLQPVLFNLYYSSTREDHFTDTDCGGCQGFNYVLEHAQGYAFLLNTSTTDHLIPLNLYWNSNPSSSPLLRGTGGDNVVSTVPPTQSGYNFVRIQGYIYDPAYPQPPNTSPVKLWYSSARLDHFTTVLPEDETEAQTNGYVQVGGIQGYMVLPNASLPPSYGPPCYQRSGNQDYYFFGHGINYADALYDYSLIAGKIPIPRRHWLGGLSWSRWDESTTETDVYNQINNLIAYQYPLHTFIFDMQWHLQPDWTGYTWDTVHYPNYTAMLSYLHSYNIPIAVNLHDAEGVQSFEQQYPAMARANGIDPTTNQTINFDIANQTYAESLHSLVLGPLASSPEHEGVDFWWTDWQQGLPITIANMTPTMILNHYRFMNYSASGMSNIRGLTHSRYPGLGGHRYPSLFGGDVIQTWPSLEFMIQFTTVGANILAGYWGHEMMRNGGSITDNTELFVRVMQFGSWSPVFTSWGNDGSNNNFWEMDPLSGNATQRALADRAQFLAYRYTLARIAYETAVSPLRPMYYDWAMEPQAYNAPEQYLLGKDVLVAPVYAPANPGTGLATVNVWFPPSTVWLDFNNPQNMYSGNADGGSMVNGLTYPLMDVPVFIRAGAMIPMIPYDVAVTPGSAYLDYSALQLVWYSGWNCTTSTACLPSAPYSTGGSAWVYEDDGISNDYSSDTYANTTIDYSVIGNTDICITIVITTIDTYPNFPSTRNYSVWLVSVPTPPNGQVWIDNNVISQGTNDNQPNTWWNDTSNPRSGGSALRVYFPTGIATDVPHVLKVCWNF